MMKIKNRPVQHAGNAAKYQSPFSRRLISKRHWHQITLARPVLGRLSLTGLLALAGISAPFLLLATDFTVAQSAPNYNLIRDSISSLAWTRMGWILTVAFLITGLLVEVFTAGLFLGIHRERGFGLGLILLACFGFGLLLIGAFRTDVPGLPPTVDGKIHGIVANTVFLLLPVANLLFSPSLKAKFWRPLFVYSIITALFAIIWIAIYRLLLPAELSWFGLYERLLVIAEVVWVEVMAIWLLRLSLRLVRTTHPAFAVSAYQATDDRLGLEV